MADPYGKRTFRSFADFAGGIGFVLINGNRLVALSGAFRERLMLVVTGINNCRYCAALHGKAAKLAGLTDQEVKDLLAGDLSSVPADEKSAVEFALAWAAADGEVGPEALDTLTTVYGEPKARAIIVALRAIRMGNLTGNTFDRVINKVTFGRAAK